MEIRNNYYNQSFKGIKLSNNNFERAVDVVMHLNRIGFEALGHRTFVVENTMKSKQKVFSSIRNSGTFDPKEFGVVFLPWSKEAYLVANPLDEQNMFSSVKKFDRGAKLNLLL